MPTAPIQKGRWVHEGLMSLPAAPPLDRLPLSTAVPALLPPLEGYTFEGFLNHDGSVGTKNILGIATTVQCVSATVEFAVRRIRSEILPRYPNVDDVIAITHPYGCGVAIDAPGSEIPIRTLAQSEPESKPWRGSDGGQPGLRKAATRANVAGKQPSHSVQCALCHPACRMSSIAALAIWSQPSWRWRKGG